LAQTVQSGREVLESDEVSGRPRSYRTGENIEKVRIPVHSDIRLNIRAMAM